MKKKCRKWTEEEDRRLLLQVRTFPQNLSRCFLIVSEITGRTPQAVSHHWYRVLAKKSNASFDSESQCILDERGKGNLFHGLISRIKSILKL